MSETTVFSHDPVMLNEVIAVFQAVPRGVVIDATLGGAGHSLQLLSSNSDISILGLDRDELAVTTASERLATFAERATVRRARFEQIDDVLESLHIDEISGALFDLGVSSPQLDRSERGFSYRVDAPSTCVWTKVSRSLRPKW